MQRKLLFALLGLFLFACTSDDSEDSEVPESSAPNSPADAGRESDEETGGDADLPGEVGRLEDPVVLTGAQLTSLGNAAATDIVAFARKDDAWTQIPVQVDERLIQDFCEIYGKSSGRWGAEPACKTSNV